MAKEIADISSKVPSKQVAGVVAKPLGSALFVWAVMDDILKDGKVHAGEISNAIAYNSPLVGNALQAGVGLGHVYLYHQDEVAG